MQDKTSGMVPSAVSSCHHLLGVSLLAGLHLSVRRNPLLISEGLSACAH